MNKREVVWLIVRLIGVYFSYLTIVSVFGLISSAAALSSLPSTTTVSSTNSNTDFPTAPVVAPNNFPAGQSNSPNKITEKPALDTVSKKAGDEAVKNLLWHIFLIALYGAIGFYFLRDGRVLFAVLNREGVIISDTKEINSLGLFDDEK